MNDIRVRFAPSPTGYLHVGGLRTALYNYLFAKKQGGKFILRIEDTDRSRYVEGAVENLLKALSVVGINWEEGPFLEKKGASFQESPNYPGVFENGEHGPYVQSERLDIYRKYVDLLLLEKRAYRCFCTPERLEKMRQEQIAAKQAPMYDRHCLSLDTEEIRGKLERGEKYVVRLKVERGKRIEFEDMVRGKVGFASDTIDDQVLLKSDGFPTYHLANVVDDHLMGISHVIRGEEWLPSTPKHLLLYEAFAWEKPEFAHLPLLLNPDRTKLSKRQGDVAVEDYLAKGYLREALLNFVALLGWNPGQGSTQEIFSLKELENMFDVSHVHKAGAVFDLAKLDWINAQYLKKLSVEELYEKALPYLEKKDFYISAPQEFREETYVKKMLAIDKERLSKLSDVAETVRFLFEEVHPSREMLSWKGMTGEEVAHSLQKAGEALGGISEEDFVLKKITEVLMGKAESDFVSAEGKVDRGKLLWPLRVALTGLEKSPSPMEVAWVLGKKETLRRIEKALVKVRS